MISLQLEYVQLGRQVAHGLASEDSPKHTFAASAKAGALEQLGTQTELPKAAEHSSQCAWMLELA